MVMDIVSLDLIKCEMCGKAAVVEQGGRRVCSACFEDERKLYAKVRALLLEYEGSSLTIQDVAETLKEDEKKISYLVDSGYFKLVMRGARPYD
jgi:hypothetical protein